MTRSTTIRWAAAAAAMLLLPAMAGCAASPSPAAEPEPTPTASVAAPSPTPEPADPLEAVAAVVVGPAGFSLVDEAGAAVETIGYLEPAGEAVDLLTRVFGEAPVDTDWEGTNHFPPATTHEWSGFTVIEQRLVDGWEELIHEPSYARPSIELRVETDAVGGVTVRSAQGMQVGASWAELPVDPRIGERFTCGGVPFELEDGAAVEAGTPTVSAAESDAGTVGRLEAPQPIADGCA
ncbi:hypothetical protein [Agromyces archimandritae]|uniref:Secreted protein n=1 Tax=Agromyces archimandritae TaxID=2781962 RepID=A0A975FNH8_9MICO|nr:hypothetical protein [Agromyces archimandritae]QTX05112.1 hypothetical protein G127AT_02425 [Agromyces archimandritae]